MQRIAVTLLVFAALVLAQSRKSITPLQVGVTENGVITNVGVDTNNVAPVLYSVYIPENATVIYFSLINNNDDNCNTLYLQVETQVPPCNTDTFDIDTSYTFCNFGTSDSSGFFDAFVEIEAGTSSSWLVQNVDTTVFVGVSTGQSYLGEACSYSLTVSFNFTCPSGSVGIRNTSNDNDAGCIFYHDVADPGNYSTSVNVNQTDDYMDEWRFPIAANTGAIHFVIESSDYMYAYGRENGGSSDDSYSCYESSDSNGDSYILNLDCYVPESGWFYLFLTSSNGELNFTLTSSVTVCAGANVGYNCSFPSFAITDFNQVYNVKFDYESGWLSYPFRYFYFDAPAILNTTNLILNVRLENTTDDDEGYAIVTKNNFPEASTYRTSSQYSNLDSGEEWTFTYTFYDAYYWPRNWIGLYCYDNTCNYTLWFTQPATTTTTTTTASATTTSASATTTGAAATTTTTAAATTTTSTTAAATTTSTTAAAATTTTSTTAAAATTTTSTTATATTTTSSTSGNATATTSGNSTSSTSASSSATTAATTSTTSSGVALIASLLIIAVAALL